MLGALICRHICTCSSRSLLPSFRGIQLAIASMYRRHGAELAPINIRQQSTFLPFKHGHPSQRIANLTLALLCFGINYVPREESPPSTASLQNKQKKQVNTMMTAASDPWHLNADISTPWGPDSPPTAYPGVFAFGLLCLGTILYPRLQDSAVFA